MKTRNGLEGEKMGCRDLAEDLVLRVVSLGEDSSLVVLVEDSIPRLVEN